MKKQITFYIDVNENNNSLCGECYFKQAVIYGSGINEYTCKLFAEHYHDTLKRASSGNIMCFGSLPPTERCIACISSAREVKS